jgi:hypothetical protein
MREHIGLWVSDSPSGLGDWRLVSPEPVFGWGGGSERSCSDLDLCPSHEDPQLYVNVLTQHGNLIANFIAEILHPTLTGNPPLYPTRGGMSLGHTY